MSELAHCESPHPPPPKKQWTPIWRVWSSSNNYRTDHRGRVSVSALRDSLGIVAIGNGLHYVEAESQSYEYPSKTAIHFLIGLMMVDLSFLGMGPIGRD